VRRPGSGSRRGRLLAGGLVLVLAPVSLGVAGGVIGPFGGSTPGPSDGPGRIVVASPTPRPTPSPTPAPTSTVARIPIVPLADLRTSAADIGPVELAAVLAGTSTRWSALELVAADADAILDALDQPAPADPTRLILAPDAATLRTDLAAHRDRLAVVRLSEVDVSVRALAWDGTALFGVDRVTSLEDWPLSFSVEVPPGGEPPAPAAYDPAGAWTLVAAGDILLDRGVATAIGAAERGADYPFDGGTATITGRHCCSSFGWKVPLLERVSTDRLVRALLQGADLTIANFENPAPTAWRHHSRGTVFNADPALIGGLAEAGFDWLSLGNNHIRDAGATGIRQTIEHLDAAGIAHSGAGADLAAARRPALLEAGGVTVALLGYDTIAASYWAEADRTGSAPMTEAIVREDVAAARAAGADLVIVFPHWGTEYRLGPSSQQLRLGHAAIDAGADLVIGNHPHWAQGLEWYAGRPIWFALGNFVFDQTWSEPTMEGLTLELTFDGTTLVQVRMRPHVILDKAQPNFLDPAGAGVVVMDQVWDGSEGYLDW
jgi:poly-gamma-glutamate synthesis protein (capsule biosynthesis protein)